MTIPDSVVSIGEYAFTECYSLESVTLGKGIKCIEFEAFHKCSGLVNVTILGTKNVIAIWGGVFNGCEKLHNIYVPDDMYIGYISSNCWAPWANHLRHASEAPATDLIDANCPAQTYIGMDAYIALTTINGTSRQ